MVKRLVSALSVLLLCILVNAQVTTEPAFIQKDYYNYIPYLELCVCYFHLKEYKKAYYYNNLAKNVKPYEQIPLKNEEFLKQFII